MSEKKKKGSGTGVVLMIIAFPLLILGMGAEGSAAFLCLGSAIVLFLISIVLQVAGAVGKG